MSSSSVFFTIARQARCKIVTHRTCERGICMYNLDPKSGANCVCCYVYIFPVRRYVEWKDPWRGHHCPDRVLCPAKSIIVSTNWINVSEKPFNVSEKPFNVSEKPFKFSEKPFKFSEKLITFSKNRTCIPLASCLLCKNQQTRYPLRNCRPRAAARPPKILGRKSIRRLGCWEWRWCPPDLVNIHVIKQTQKQWPIRLISWRMYSPECRYVRDETSRRGGGPMFTVPVIEND